jgi:hypothetical protein
MPTILKFNLFPTIVTKLSILLGAEDRARTGHPQLGRLTLYQMSYFRLLNYSNSFGREFEIPIGGERRIRTFEVIRQQIYSLSHLAALEFPLSKFLKRNLQLERADGGIRTPDLLITNQWLWPTELHRHWFNTSMNNHISLKKGLQMYALFN